MTTTAKVRKFRTNADSTRSADAKRQTVDRRRQRQMKRSAAR